MSNNLTPNQLVIYNQSRQVIPFNSDLSGFYNPDKLANLGDKITVSQLNYLIAAVTTKFDNMESRLSGIEDLIKSMKLTLDNNSSRIQKIENIVLEIPSTVKRLIEPQGNSNRESEMSKKLDFIINSLSKTPMEVDTSHIGRTEQQLIEISKKLDNMSKSSEVKTGPSEAIQRLNLLVNSVNDLNIKTKELDRQNREMIEVLGKVALLTTSSKNDLLATNERTKGEILSMLQVGKTEGSRSIKTHLSEVFHIYGPPEVQYEQRSS